MNDDLWVGQRVPTVTTASRFDYELLDPRSLSSVQERIQLIASKIRLHAFTIVEIGRELLKIKQEVSHGQFGALLRAEFGWDERTAQRYISVAVAFDGKTDTVSVLPPMSVDSRRSQERCGRAPR